MIATQNEIRSRIEQITLNYNGYKRQLARLDLTQERQTRLEIEVRLLEEELATLEKIAQLGRVEPNRSWVEASVRERVVALQEQLDADPALAGLQPDERELASGEMRALRWALGEDMLSQVTRELNVGQHKPAPENTDRVVAAMLTRTLENGPDAELRASAAYDLGKLGIVQAIPLLAAALNDEPLVAGIALHSLCGFSDEQLRQAGLSGEQLAKVRAARNPA